MKKSSFILMIVIIMGTLLSTSFNHGLENVASSTVFNSEWQITITGLVDTPLNLKLSDLIAMPQTTIFSQIFCVGPPGFFVDEGNWTGVKLGLLLETAGVSPDAIKVAFHASDGFSTDLTIASAKSDNILVAYEKDGAPINETLRLIVPGRWGYKWIYNLNSIELVDYNFLGKYESQGYSDSAEITQTGAPGNIPNVSQGGTTSNNNLPTPSPYASPSSSPIQKPSSTPTTKPEGEPIATPTRYDILEETIIVIAVVAAVSVVMLSLTVYFLKFKKRKIGK